MNGFYMLWSPSGSKPPRIRHETQESEQKEAERLAIEHPGHEFFVMAAMTRSVMPALITERLQHGDEIPF